MKFTKRIIEALEPKGVRQSFFDDTLKGFCVRVGASGEKSFYVVYRAGKGRNAQKRWLRLGLFPSLTVEQARQLAKQALADVAQGRDPAEAMQAEKKVLSVRAALVLFSQEHIQARLKPHTVTGYLRLIEKLILPSMGSVKLTKVTARHCAALHHSLRETPYQANRCLAVLSKFFSWCERAGYSERGSNPAAQIEKFKEHKRVNFMSAPELEAIGASIALLEAQGRLSLSVASVFRLLLFTGARVGEILSLKWSYLNLEQGLANLPDSKTGAKVLHLPTLARTVLLNLPRLNEYCFYGPGKTGHMVEVKASWRLILDTAGLSGWRVHDLRHAFASYAVNSGKSLPLIGKILGHTQAATTQRYAHVANNPVAAAVEETATLIQKDLTCGKVLPFTQVSA